jgi:thiamine-phosphate pyrophosphorylase
VGDAGLPMKVVVVSPEHDHPREHAVVAELFAGGLERFHLRKPHASVTELETYLQRISAPWRSRVVLHQHHELVERFGLGGKHWRDDGVGRVIPNPPISDRRAKDSAPYLTSRSCHDLATLRGALGQFDAVFFGPVFASISKPGYGPVPGNAVGEALGAILCTRTKSERQTEMIAIGGIDASTARRAEQLGFDGIAVLGAVWQAADPVAAFDEIRQSAERDVPIELRAVADISLAKRSQTSAMGTSRSTSTC